jgi:hypothetical protein
VGHFAADKLARHLEMVSRCPGSPHEVRAAVNWDLFDDERSMLDEGQNRWELGPAAEISGHSELACGPVRVRLFVFDLDGESLARIGPRMEVRAWLREWTGVRIDRDGFRVWPYREPHGSWNRSGYRRRIAMGPFDAPTREAGTAIRKGHPTGVATLPIDKSPGDRLRRADELDVEGVDPEGLVRQLTDHGMNDAIGFSDPS